MELITFFLLIFGLAFYVKIYIPIARKREAKNKLKEEENWKRKEEIRKREEQLEQEIREREENEKEVKRILDNVNYCFDKYILVDSIVLDSNIWMDPEYEAFFAILQEKLSQNNKKTILYEPQFDEICNIKTKNDIKSRKGSAARCAINRIENFQLNELLSIKPLSIKADKNAYADPIIIKMILRLIKNEKKVVLITDDMELRIRLRSVSEENKNRCVVLPGKDIVYDTIEYCHLMNWKYETANVENYYSDFDNNDNNAEEMDGKYNDNDSDVSEQKVIYQS